MLKVFRSIKESSVLDTYQDAKGARVEKRRVDRLIGFKGTTPGEAHFFFKSKIVREKFFYLDPN